MCPKSNAHINTKPFKVMIHKKWLPLTELTSITKHFYKEDKRSYGRTFIIKKNVTLKRYGVFIKERRRQTKEEMDKDYEQAHIIINLSSEDWLLYVLEHKREGISLLKSLLGKMV